LPSPELSAVWLVRSRAVAASLRFWLLIAGLDERPRTLNDRLYLGYVLAFFALWAFALLTLLAGLGANLLVLLPLPPDRAASLLALVGLLGWALVAAWNAAKRSPLLFSDADGQLLCQTPVPRAQVALVWLVTGWPIAALPIWAAAAILGYAQVEIALGAGITVNDLPRYLLAGFRALVPVVPLHLGLVALAWCLGVYRLQGDREVRGLRLLPVGIGVLLFALLLGPGPASLPWQMLTLPLALPLGSAFGVFAWGTGVLGATVLAAAALLLLAATSRALSLSRAAQETRGLEALRIAQLTGTGEWAAEQTKRRRLGSGRSPARLPARAGAWSLVWKRAVQTLRGLTFTSAFTWLLPGTAALGLVLVPDPGARLWSGLMWAYFSVQACAGPLRQDLSRWWVLRGLPFAQARLLLAAIAVPATLVLLATTPALLLGLTSGDPVAVVAAAMLPGGAAIASGAAALDVLRRVRSSSLLAGVIPGVSSLALVLVVVALLPPLGLYLRLAAASTAAATVAAAASSLAAAALLGWSATHFLGQVP